jgi:hypothetical protein
LIGGEKGVLKLLRINALASALRFCGERRVEWIEFSKIMEEIIMFTTI